MLWLLLFVYLSGLPGAGFLAIVFLPPEYEPYFTERALLAIRISIAVLWPVWAVSLAVVFLMGKVLEDLI